MAQLHCYVPDKYAKRLQEKAKQAHLSVSKYIASLIEKEVGENWPEGYFEIFGTWQGDNLSRPDQGVFETRVEFD